MGGVDYHSLQLNLPLRVIGYVPREMQARIDMDMEARAAMDAGEGGTMDGAGSIVTKGRATVARACSR